MAKSNNIIIDANGNEITYYGCATISDACELGGVTTDITDSNKLVVIDDVLNNYPYNVQLTSNPKIEYSDNTQSVAYDDLIVYSGTDTPLIKPSNQKFGVMSLGLGMKASPLQVTGQNINLDDYLSYSSMGSSMVNINGQDTVVVPEYFRIQLTSPFNVYSNTSTLQGYEIIIQNFLSDLYDASSLEITELNINDGFGAMASTNLYSTEVDASRFNITNTSQKRAVVDLGSSALCGMIKQGTSEKKYTQYTNFDATTPQTLSLMLLLSSKLNLQYTDQLISTIDVYFTYLKLNENGDGAFKAKSHMTIELWAENTSKQVAVQFKDLEIQDGELPEIEENESGATVTIDPDRTILYTTNTGLPLNGYTNKLGSEFVGGVSVENTGMTTIDGQLVGWIQYTTTLTQVGLGTLLDANRTTLTSITLPKGITTIQGFQNCTALTSVKFPSTLETLKDNAFLNSSITRLDFGQIEKLTVGYYAFKNCSSLTTIVSPKNMYVEDCAFENAVNLETVEFLNETGKIYVGFGGFKNCKSLKTDVLKYSKLGTLGQECFAGCTSLTKITLDGQMSRGKLTQAWSGLIPVIGWAAAIIEVLSKMNPKAFYGCSNLESIYINDIVQTDGSSLYGVTGGGFAANTFKGCCNVKHIYCNSKHPPYLGIGNIWKNGAINPKTCKLYIPTGRTAAYRSKAQWGDFPLDNIIEYTPEQFTEVENLFK